MEIQVHFSVVKYMLESEPGGMNIPDVCFFCFEQESNCHILKCLISVQLDSKARKPSNTVKFMKPLDVYESLTRDTAKHQ